MRIDVHHQASGNPFVLPQIVADYEAWYETAGRRADHLEKALLRQLLAGFAHPNTILEVGCGTGHFTRWFSQQGFQAVGLDLSHLMLLEAVRLGSPPCVRGDALALPFPSRSFDLVALITTLEFLPDPAHALTEAMRVAQDGLILGALNRQSLLGRQLRDEGGVVWGAARFFTPAELVKLVRRAAVGTRVDVVWRTTLWPVWPRELPLPWGGFIGLAAQMTQDRAGGAKMKREYVRDWMTPDPLTIDPGLSVSEAYRLMKERGIRRLPVVEGDRLVGIVTLGDLRAAVASPEGSLNIFEMAFHMERFTVMQIMTYQVVTVTPDTPIEVACRLMLKHKIGGLPVVADGRLVGILTESDIFRLVAQRWSKSEEAVRELWRPL